MAYIVPDEQSWSEIQKEVSFQAQRSRGPGGQNVNKTNSSVRLQWDFMNSAVLNDEQKNLLYEKLSAWISSDNILAIRSDIHRDQERNKNECLQKLKRLIEGAFFKHKPRKKTKPTRSSKVKRRESKGRRSELKKNRTKRNANYYHND